MNRPTDLNSISLFSVLISSQDKLQEQLQSLQTSFKVIYFTMGTLDEWISSTKQKSRRAEAVDARFFFFRCKNCSAS
jgi:hypothetical protein